MTLVRVVETVPIHRPAPLPGAIRLHPDTGHRLAADAPEWEDLEAFARDFLSRVVWPAGTRCWTWAGAHDPKGYGNVRIPKALRAYFGGRRWMKAHLVAMVLFGGEDPTEIEHGHHVCTEKGEPFDAYDCVNPEHLEARTLCDHNRLHSRRRRRR